VVTEKIKVQTFVFVGSDVWTEDWGWNEDEQMEEDDSESGESTGDERKHNWLQDCLTSISPANDLMAVAYGDKLVLLSRKFYKDLTKIQLIFLLCKRFHVVLLKAHTLDQVSCCFVKGTHP
jgi:hypothetical protein